MAHSPQLYVAFLLASPKLSIYSIQSASQLVVRCHSLVSRDIPLSICVHGKLVTLVWFIVPSCNIICMFYLRWHRQSCTYSTQFASLLVVCCQVKLAKSCSNVGQVDQKLVKRWSKVGQKLVKLVKKFTNLVKLVKNWLALRLWLPRSRVGRVAPDQ